ncbi:MAG: hypothetical protein RMH75_03325 [Archaeoglobaceae archaeon]|nr:hypothetical protein [Archaeoglobaceae archaeon]MDW7989687.1 hypothetical protein [Archaeoglobaceae archaeon]
MLLLERVKVMQGNRLREVNILIEENRISSIGDKKDKRDIVIDAKGLVAIPRLFNSHTIQQ